MALRPLLVTAGATRNPVDAIRFLSARSSGSTGAWLAARLTATHSVTLMGSPEACLRAPPGVAVVEFGSTRDLMDRMEKWCRANPSGVVLHAAAVGDYEAEPLPGKIPSRQPEVILRLRPAPKIVDHVREWAPESCLVSFKAAPPGTNDAALEEVARAQLRRTGSAAVFANAIGALDGVALLVLPDAGHRFTERRTALEALAKFVEDATLADDR